ncbi:hypothetical protein [Streptomyces alboviridis]|uniref:hypothetical protein n=1 Tax=Streptomyces alboviridis TaxID=67269 RepID=UPI000516D6EF|nr:hypothetical protein [Streptomyces alboviridis]
MPTSPTLRDRIAEALISWTYRGKEPDPEAGILETVRANAYSRADAVLAVLPATDTPADGSAALRAAADFYERVLNESLDPDSDPRYCTAVRDIVIGLRRRADETAGKSCAHCGQPVTRVTGTLAAWWVHDPGGNTVCDPQRAASSTRATPERVKHSGPDAEFCVLCLSGEHERVDD